MTPANEVQFIFLQKLGNCISPESTRNTPITIGPALYSRIRIRPKQITEETIIWNLRGSFDLLNLIQLFQFWRESSMHANYLFVYECSNRQTIKAVSEYLPKPNIESPLTFVIKPINTVDFGIFVISPQEENFIRIPYFVSQ